MKRAALAVPGAKGPSCLNTLNAVKDDTLAETMRHVTPAELEGSHEQPVKELIERVSQLSAELTDAYTAGGTANLDFLTPPQTPDEIGRLGGDRVLRVLCEGGMGIVFLAEDRGARPPRNPSRQAQTCHHTIPYL